MEIVDRFDVLLNFTDIFFNLEFKVSQKNVCIGQNSSKAIHIESYHYSNWRRFDKDDG